MPRRADYKKVPTTIYVTPEQHKILHLLSRTHRITIAQLTRLALNRFIREELTKLKGATKAKESAA